ncbi:hypothetical protein CEUSTIGMA_g11548.t1 [Chlamydomonas eustigma]|uniref:Uncharacterized protein n=1 Tax=Chlamydomonas eustigma TaxID=1157962 RepID=A0A250XLZ5_9CHLO|nr:hypothetical protein CEUSTIGMA_g11548.t1 [Chlamydomonas eustigma]|eukprot:GAX84125.1 hypothetical protein CEUSTIGMA_g11548.t1 [Chlamydomonas eustigma]
MVPNIIKEAFRQLSTKKHRINSPNLAQGIDVNTLDILLQRSIYPSSLALPTLKYLEFLNPRQVCGLLQKLPQLERLHMHRLRHERRNQSAWSSEQLDISMKLMSALQARLSKIMHNCTSTQIEQGLWGLAVSNRGYPYKSQQLLTESTAVADRLAEWLNASYQAITLSSSASSSPPLKPVSTLLPSPNDRVHMTPKTLSMAAWWLATADQGNHEAMAQIVSCLPSLLTDSMLQQTLPSTQQQPSTMIRLKSASNLKSKRRKREAARKGLTVADRVYKGLQPPTASVVAQEPLLDHRSLCRLAWAFASSGVKDEAAWRVICEAARSSLDTLLQVVRCL